MRCEASSVNIFFEISTNLQFLTATLGTNRVGVTGLFRASA